MKILLTVHQFLPDFSAGTEVLTYSVAQELMARGHDVIVMTGFPSHAGLSDEERLDEYYCDGIHVYRFNHAYEPMGQQHSRMDLEYNNGLSAIYFRDLLLSFEPDIVHFFHFARLGTTLITCATELGVPTFYTPTDFWAICPNARLTYSNGVGCKGPSSQGGNCALHLAALKVTPALERVASRVPAVFSDTLAKTVTHSISPASSLRQDLAAIKVRLPMNIERLNTLSKIVAPNSMIATRLIEHGVKAESIITSAYGIDLKNASLAAPRVRSSKLRIGFIGTLAPHKGCHTLIEAFKLLGSGQATLNIYGSELDFPKYFRMLACKVGGDDSISFNGTFPNKDIAKVLAKLDLLVVPSLWPENTPLIIYSAHAAGCPVVASNVPGIADSIRHGVDGMLFEQGSVLDLHACLLKLLEEPQTLGRLAKNSIMPKSSAQYVDDLLEIWGDNSSGSSRV